MASVVVLDKTTNTTQRIAWVDAQERAANDPSRYRILIQSYSRKSPIVTDRGLNTSGLLRERDWVNWKPPQWLTIPA